MKPIHDNCRRIREAWHMERVPMAELFGVTRGKWVNYELGTTEPPPEILLKMEEMTGITIRRLLTEELTKSMIPDKPLVNDEIAETPPQYFFSSDERDMITDSDSLPILERLRRLEIAVFGS